MISVIFFFSASVHSLAAPFGSLLSGPIMDAFGRRGALQVSAIPLAVGWIVMGLAQNVPTIISGRIISGFAVGLVSVPSQVRDFYLERTKKRLCLNPGDSVQPLIKTGIQISTLA